MNASVEIVELEPRYVFRISRGAKASAQNVIFRLESDGITGIGEASPNAEKNLFVRQWPSLRMKVASFLKM